MHDSTDVDGVPERRRRRRTPRTEPIRAPASDLGDSCGEASPQGRGYKRPGTALALGVSKRAPGIGLVSPTLSAILDPRGTPDPTDRRVGRNDRAHHALAEVDMGRSGTAQEPMPSRSRPLRALLGLALCSGLAGAASAAPPELRDHGTLWEEQVLSLIHI